MFQILNGTLIQCELVTPKPNKDSGEIKAPYTALSVMSKFSKFGRVVPEIVTINAPASDLSKYQDKVNKVIDLQVTFPVPQYSLKIV